MAAEDDTDLITEESASTDSGTEQVAETERPFLPSKETTETVAERPFLPSRKPEISTPFLPSQKTGQVIPAETRPTDTKLPPFLPSTKGTEYKPPYWGLDRTGAVGAALQQARQFEGGDIIPRAHTPAELAAMETAQQFKNQGDKDTLLRK
jgi:hypothetical protein